ncbi:LacI family DNA-binding transcriptional regulator [Carnobacterium sp.]|uniref:LacI family DNA-binding transcriptional regulator n=1 Tax=Carnobacterium sp. TaxID=48221 RepID=UPI003C753638
MANIKDVAKLSGCSVTTVSRVLNNHPHVSKEKKQRILTVIKELDYAPNSQARDLILGASKNIGVVIPNVNHSYFEKIISGVIESAFEIGYAVTLLPTNYDPKIEKSYFQQLKTKRLDALILTSKCNSLAEIEKNTKYGPIICCEDTQNYAIPSVYADRGKAYTEIFNYLKDAGYKNIGVTINRSEEVSASSKTNIESYEKVLGIPIEGNIVRNCSTMEDGKMAASYFFEEGRNFDAIVTNGDHVASGIYKYAKDHQLSQPLLIGQENLAISEVLSFTTIDFHLKKIGSAAFQLAVSGEMEKQIFPYSIIKRMPD